MDGPLKKVKLHLSKNECKSSGDFVSSDVCYKQLISKLKVNIKTFRAKTPGFTPDRLVFLVTKYRQELINPSLLGFTMVRHKVIIQFS